MLLQTLQGYLTQVQALLHDTTQSSWTNAELISRINEAREDTALDMHCVRKFTTGIQLVVGQELYPIDGAVAGANITNGGVYTGTPPTATFDPAPAGGTTASGIVVLNSAGTAVSSITMTIWGQGYTSAPAIAFTPASTTAATAVTLINSFNVISITPLWNNERYMLGFRGFTMFQAYARGWVTSSQGRPGVWTIHPQMLQVYVRRAPDQLYLSEWDTLSLPNPLVNLTDIDREVIPPWNKAVQFRASELALMKHQNFAQAAYYGGLYDKRVPKYIIGAGGYRMPNPYNRNFQRSWARM